MSDLNPQINDAVVIDPPVDGYSIVHHEGLKKYFRLGAREAAFLGTLDGTVSAEEIRNSGREGFAPEQADRLLEWFAGSALLAGSSQQTGEDAPLSGWRKTLNYVLYPDRFRVTLFNPDNFLNRHRGIVDAFFSRGAVAIYLFIFLSPAIFLIAMPDNFLQAFNAFDPFLPLWQWVLLYVTTLVLTFFHEMSHAIACKHYGGKVDKVGGMLLYLNPVAYCDISASWRFTSALPKVVVSGAGIFFQLLVATASFVIFGLTQEPFFALLSSANAVFAFFNMTPFVKLDGYWMLVHLVGEPNLRHKGLARVDNAIRRLIGRPAGEVTDDWMLFGFGMAHVIFVPLFWLLGLSAIYRAALWLVPEWAIWIILPFIIVMAYRLVSAGLSYRRTLQQT